MFILVRVSDYDGLEVDHIGNYATHGEAYVEMRRGYASMLVTLGYHEVDMDDVDEDQRPRITDDYAHVGSYDGFGCSTGSTEWHIFNGGVL